jgi:prepilin-type N-terminal cleavage/methylation domain-containing protein
MNRSAGFTLIEVLVVAAITVMISGFLISNFSRSRVDLNQVLLTSLDAVREAQSQALSGALLKGAYRCGYGIHFIQTGYTIYAGPDSAAVDCTTQDRNFDGSDTVVRQALLPSNILEFVMPIPDIFFEPPDPTTYIGGTSTPGSSTTVRIHRKGAPCPGPDCRTIYVSTSGRIQSQ